MKIDSKIIDDLKTKYKDIYQVELRWKDEKNENHLITIIHKRPTVEDIEIFQKEAQTNMLIAQRNLFHNLVVYPENKKELHDKIGTYYGVYLQFVNSITPFLGLDATINRVEL